MILPKAWLIDTYPVLRFVLGYLGTLRKWHHLELGLFRREMEGVRKEVVHITLSYPLAHSHSHTHYTNLPNCQNPFPMHLYIHTCMHA